MKEFQLDVTKKSNLPAGWEYVQLSKLLKIKHGKSQKDVENKNGIYPILGSGGVMGYADSYIWNKPSVMIGRKGTINKPQFYETPFWTVDTLFYTDIKINVDPKWVFFLFQSINWLKYNEASGVPSLSASTIESIKVKKAPYVEQKKIAEIISTWDRAIDLKENIIENLNLKLRSLYHKFFDIIDTKNSRMKIQLGKLCKISKGIQLNKLNMISHAEFPVINGGIEPSGYIDNYNFKANSITISEGGNSCGFVNYIETPFWAGGHCYVLSIDEKYSANSRYVFHYLKSQEKKIKRLRVGSGLPNIQKKELEKFQLWIHNSDEQTDIVNLLDLTSSNIYLANAELEQLRLQKKGLMQQLLTGKIRVQC